MTKKFSDFLENLKEFGIQEDKKSAVLFGYLVGVVEILRGEAGCAWDKKQTEQDLREFLLEEVYELISAINKSDPEEVKEEIGDLLLLCVFLARIYYEKGLFSISDSLTEIINKLIRRHPHVFGDLEISDPDEIILNWTKIKNQEKQNKNKSPISVWDAVPKTGASLFRYYIYLKEHKKHNMPLNLDKVACINVLREMNEDKIDKACIQNLLAAICKLAYISGINPELAFSEKIDELGKKSNL